MFKKTFIFILFGALLLSCKKNDSAVGVDVLPSSDQLGGAYAEIIPKITYTKMEDSLLTTNFSNSNVLGSVNDPIFGRFDASMYINFEPAGTNLGGTGLGTHPVLDSAVLVLEYNTSASINYIGDTTQPLRVDVFPLKTKLIRDSVYYSTRKIAYDATDNLVEGGHGKTFTPRLYTRFLINKDDPAPTPYPQLRVRLKKEFGEMLFNPNYIFSVAAFQNAFYGFYITTENSVLPQPSYGSAFYVNMITSSISLYYHDDENDVVAPVIIYCGPNSTRFEHFSHDYQFLAEPQLSQQLYAPYDTLNLGKQNIYLQGGGGVRAKVEFPDLASWRDSNVVINKAELRMTVDQSKPDYYNRSLYPLPLRLFLEGEDAVTHKPTVLFENVLAFGGGLSSPSTTQNYYSFNIPHSVTQYITKKSDNLGFFASVYSPVLFPQRVVLGGWGNSNAPMKLRLWYTRLKFPK